MDQYNKKYSTDKLYFNETPFHKLMQKRINEVLLVCSKYDKFILEEDGRIEERIFHEYTALNLRYPPRFTHASSEEDAFNKLENKYYDLVITMVNSNISKPFALARKIKDLYPEKPIVALTNFSREVNLDLEEKDCLESIDHIFSWLGNANLLLAIVKLLEDKLNVEYDVKKIGVQTIILVEDNIRYYSSYLPNIYKVIFEQEDRLMREGLNEHQRTMRMRGRPKILLANNYEQATSLVDKYQDNLLGVITDITYKKGGMLDKKAGLKLCDHIRKKDKYLPILIQSSQSEHEIHAGKFNAGFIRKDSKNLIHEITEYVQNYFGFGDFIFRDPKQNFEEIARVTTLRDLQHEILNIPDHVFEYHALNNHFSKWMKTRILYTLGNMIKKPKRNDFESVESMKHYLQDTIKNYRVYKGRGTISDFKSNLYDEYIGFTRIGKGSLGGKARGLAFIDSSLKRNRLNFKYDNVIISIPKTVVLTTDVFEEFMAQNNLYQFALEANHEDEEILKEFLKHSIPESLIDKLKVIIEFMNKPIAVRSSSLLEDSHYQPFAGVYATYMIPNNNDSKEVRLQELCDAIKSVYASTFYKSSKDYMQATHNVIDEEKMAVIIQEVVGEQYGDYYYPNISGVARSLNFYPTENEKTKDGIANISLGLGKTIVDGGISLRFSPKHPKKIMQISNASLALQNTQKKFYAIDMKELKFSPSIDEDCTLVNLDIDAAIKDGTTRYMTSTYDYKDGKLKEGSIYEGKKLLTFSGILKYDAFPLAQIIDDLMQVGCKEMDLPIEIEFALDTDLKRKDNIIFNFLQIRPIVETSENENVIIKGIKEEDTIIYAYTALGNGTYDDLTELIYVKPENFNSAKTKEIAKIIEKLNEQAKKENKYYILIGPGRWGSSDPWLGIPVSWTQISMSKIIVEASLKDFHIDPSQGSHFFQNITSFRLGYLTVNPHLKAGGFYDLDYLNSLEAVYEDEFVRKVSFKEPKIVKIDGKSSLAVILK